MSNPADLCRECEVTSKTRELEEAIKELILGRVEVKRNDRTCKQSLQVGLNQYIETNSEEGSDKTCMTQTIMSI